MIQRRIIPFLIIAMICPAIMAENAVQTFNELFGDQVKKVTGTPEKDDDIELAKELMSSAANINDAEMLAVIYLKSL